MYLKVLACVFTLFPNKSACIYDNKHGSKQIPWIDEFQNEKDIQLSLVNIMPFRYQAALLHWLSSARSINSLVWVRAWVTRMTCFACQESCLFSLAKFPLSSDLIYEWAQMHLIILRGRNPRRPIRIHLFVCKKSSSALSRRASRQLLAKEYA